MPEPFWEVRVHNIDLAPSLYGLCVGYERDQWRTDQLGDHIFEWLPEFALTPSEWQAMQHANSVRLMRRAAQHVYTTAKFANRGEFGELFLHAIVRQVHNSIPVISKIYYKSSNNETVKGFDAVHVVGPPEQMELWLGEAKFYNDIKRAIRDVIVELETHLGTDYLRSEFNLITGKIDNSIPHAEKLRKLLSPNTSLDEVFNRAAVPVLLTYDSECVAAHKSCTKEYVDSFKSEIEKHHASFLQALSAKKGVPKNITIHLFLLPLAEKTKLIAVLEEKLKAWQKI
ncbi:HamA C-terminal domain-containing protein [Planctomicrobium sp. SH661]|uniref:HamA C-terminal domain-containing protein n=1 Tax=Planctomicrobium sp. SH661 TaxID=3448124 RepID=UPI003F5C2B63